MKYIGLAVRKPAVLSIVSILFSLITGGIILLLIGKDPVLYFRLLFARGMGTSLGVIEAVIKMAPLLIISAGLLPCFSAGLWNIGVEGQFLIGAMLTGFMMTVVISWTPDMPGDFAERLVPFFCALLIAFQGSKKAVI